MSRKQLEGLQPLHREPSSPNWRLGFGVAGSSSSVSATEQALQSLLEDRFAKFASRAESQFQNSLAELQGAAKVCQDALQQQRLLNDKFDTFHAEQSHINTTMLSQMQEASDRMSVLQARQDQAKESYRARLQALEHAQQEGLNQLRAMLQEDKRQRNN